jgi:hypothetical protein
MAEPALAAAGVERKTMFREHSDSISAPGAARRVAGSPRSDSTVMDDQPAHGWAMVVSARRIRSSGEWPKRLAGRMI